MMNPLEPSPSILCKLGSIAVHAEEMFSPTGHPFDRVELEQRLKDPEIQEWLAAMGGLAMIPVKRTMEDVALALKRNKKGKK